MNIKNSDRLIFAVDVSEVEQAKDLVTQLGSSVDFFKNLSPIDEYSQSIRYVWSSYTTKLPE